MNRHHIFIYCTVISNCKIFLCWPNMVVTLVCTPSRARNYQILSTQTQILGYEYNNFPLTIHFIIHMIKYFFNFEARPVMHRTISKLKTVNPVLMSSPMLLSCSSLYIWYYAPKYFTGAEKKNFISYYKKLPVCITIFRSALSSKWHPVKMEKYLAGLPDVTNGRSCVQHRCCGAQPCSHQWYNAFQAYNGASINKAQQSWLNKDRFNTY